LAHGQVHLHTRGLLPARGAERRPPRHHMPLAASAHGLTDGVLPRHNVRAMVWLMTITGSPEGMSRSEMSRPATRRDAQRLQVAIAYDAHKRDGELSPRVYLPLAGAPNCDCAPAERIGQPAATIPGTARTRRSASSMYAFTCAWLE